MKWYKSLALVLAGVLCCGMFACSDKERDPGTDTPGGPDNPGGGTTVTVPTGTVTEPDEHLVTNGLHKVTVTETSNPFVTDERSRIRHRVGHRQRLAQSGSAYPVARARGDRRGAYARPLRAGRRGQLPRRVERGRALHRHERAGAVCRGRADDARRTNFPPPATTSRTPAVRCSSRRTR